MNEARPQGGEARCAPGGFWFVWAVILAATVLLSWWSHRSSELPFENRAGRWLYFHHHFFPLSNQFWEYLGLVGQVPTIVVVALLAALALGLRHRLVEAGLVVLALSMGLVQVALRALVDRPGFSGARELGRGYPSASSYPSGHAFGEFLVFGLIFAFAPLLVRSRHGIAALRVACVGLITFGGLERLVDARHWPSDVIGAHLLALLYVSAAWWFARAGNVGHGRQS